MNLQRFVALVTMELKKLIRQPANLFLNLLFPVVLTAALIFVFSDPAMGMSIASVVPGLIVYAVIFLIMTIAQSFSSEKQEGLLKRLSTTPMTSDEFIGSRILAHMVIVTVQVIIVFAVAFALGFRPESGVEGMLAALPVTAIFSLSTVGLGLITATVAKTPEVATGISFVFILPQMFFGTFIPITRTTQHVAALMPSYYLRDALQLIFEGNWTNPNILIDAGVITVVSVAVVVLGVLLFEKYGKA
jgi:ABC-type multidrug transport system permease subunit